MIEIIKSSGGYKLVQFKREQRYICNKCSPDVLHPKKTFAKEKDIITHIKDKHGPIGQKGIGGGLF